MYISPKLLSLDETDFILKKGENEFHVEKLWTHFYLSCNTSREELCVRQNLSLPASLMMLTVGRTVILKLKQIFRQVAKVRLRRETESLSEDKNRTKPKCIKVTHKSLAKYLDAVC